MSPKQLGRDRYWEALDLAERVLNDLSEPDPQLRTIGAFRAACSRLRDEIRAVLADGSPLATKTD